MTITKRRAMDAAKRIEAHMRGWKMPVGRWIEKDAFVLAHYVLAQRKKRLTNSQRT